MKRGPLFAQVTDTFVAQVRTDADRHAIMPFPPEAYDLASNKQS